MRRLATALLLLGALTAFAAGPPDVVFRSDGSSVAGEVKTADAKFLRIEVQVAANQPKALMSVPIAAVERIDFGETQALEAYLNKTDRGTPAEVERFWNARRALLAVPESMAGEFGLRLADLLIASPEKAGATRALGIFQEIEAKDWDDARQSRAREGRLRALVRLGRAGEAVKEASEMSESAENPEVLIEARFVLAEARAQQLRDLEKENPRWQIDDRVRPERNRLYNEALDLYLYPFLFQGAQVEPSARGLWRASELYAASGDRENATATARDVAVLYPATSYAGPAAVFLKSKSATKSDEPKNETR